MEPNMNNDSSTTGAENPLNGSLADEGQTSANQPQFVSVEQMNRALSGYNNRLEKKFQETLTNALNPLQQLLGNLQNPVNVDDTVPSNTPVQTPQPSQPNKEILKLQRSLDEMNQRVKASEQERETAVKQAIEEKVKSQVLSTLTGLKVEKGDQVFKLIRDNIVIGDDGSVKMKAVDPSFGFEEEKDLKSGLTDWLNSDGIHFLPPRNIGGSGASNTKSGTGQRIINPQDLAKMKPSELAKVNLKEVFGNETLATFFNTNQ